MANSKSKQTRMKMKRSQKAQARAILDRLQRPYPGIELLLWQLRLKITDATIPESILGLQGSPKNFSCDGKGDRPVYNVCKSLARKATPIDKMRLDAAS